MNMTFLFLDCSGIFMDLVNGEFTYTTPTYQDNRQCTVVIKNTLFRNHVMEVKFVKFDLEESDNCSFDSLKIMAGEGESEYNVEYTMNRMNACSLSTHHLVCFAIF